MSHSVELVLILLVLKSQTYNFLVVLLVKTGIFRDDRFNRLPLPLTLNADQELRNTAEDPLRYLTLTNVVTNPSLKANGKPWRGSREISDVLFQVIIEMCTKPGHLVADLSTSTGASYRACMASGQHFFGLEPDKEIFSALLKPLCSHSEESPLLVGRRKAQPWRANKSGK